MLKTHLFEASCTIIIFLFDFLLVQSFPPNFIGAISSNPVYELTSIFKAYDPHMHF
jgi:hypothetical protein